jgi:hypothetical protein
MGQPDLMGASNVTLVMSQLNKEQDKHGMQYVQLNNTHIDFILNIQIMCYNTVHIGQYSSVGIVTCYGLDGPGIESQWGEISRTHPDHPWGPPSLLHDGYRVLPGVKRPGHGADHPSPSSAEVKERVELYLYSPSGPSWPVIVLTLPFTIQYTILIYLYPQF